MIKPLTTMRFIFAMMVFGSHLNFLEKSNFYFSKWFYKNILFEGYLGVSFFFILSGFILAYNYQTAIVDRQKSIKTFYIARLARIYPLHILTFLISIPLTYSVFIVNKLTWFYQAIANIILIQSFIPIKDFYFSFNGVSWSISDEFFFYFMFPLIILFTSKNKHKLYILLGSMFLIIVLLLYLISEDYFHSLFYISPFLRITDFMIGILCFSIFKNSEYVIKNANFNFLEISAIIVLVFFFSFHQFIPAVARYSFYYWIPMSFLIYSFSFQKGKLSAFLSGKIGLHLGEISFGFYMFHQLVLKYFLKINTKLFHFESDIAICIVVFTITLLVSHCSYVYFETPLNSYIKRIWVKNDKNTILKV